MPVGLGQLWREVGALAEVVETALLKNKSRPFLKTRRICLPPSKLSRINTTPVTTEKGELVIQDSRAYNKRGLAYVSTRNYEQAIVDFSKALKLDLEYAEAYNNRSTAHLLMDNYGQTVTDCSQALKLAPDFGAAYVNRGIAYTGLSEYEQAWPIIIKLGTRPQNVLLTITGVYLTRDG